MAHYYVDFTTNPPPFASSLPGAIGYISKGGLTVLYGHKTPGDIQRQNHLPSRGWPDGEDAIQKRIAQIVGISENRKNNILNPRCCAACGEKPEEITRHHIIPKEVGTDNRTIRLCLDCHTEIHRLPNRHISKMSVADQIAFINIRRPRTANFQLVEIPKQKRSKRDVPTDPVFASMLAQAGAHRHKKKVDHKNRHHGSNF